jgi:hypothetical protein
VSRNARLFNLSKTLVGWLGCPLLSAAIAQATSDGGLAPGPGLPTRARVVIVEDNGATRAFQPREEPVRRLLERGLTNLTGRSSQAAAWQSLVSTQDVIGLKVHAVPGPSIGTRPAVVGAVVEGLLQAGVAPSHIVIWDKQMDDLRRAGFVELAARHGVRVAGAAQAGWDAGTFYEAPLLGHLVYGDLEFSRTGENVGRKSHLSMLVTKQLSKIINISPLLNHNSAGVCGNLYTLTTGSADNMLRFEGDPLRLAQAVPEIYAMPALGDHVILNIVDALVAQYQGEQEGRLHYASPLNQLRLSTDPVALDLLSIEELDRQREFKGTSSQSNTNILDIYRNAALLEIGVGELRRIQVETLR